MQRVGRTTTDEVVIVFYPSEKASKRILKVEESYERALQAWREWR